MRCIRDRRDRDFFFSENEFEKAKRYIGSEFERENDREDFLGSDEEYSDYMASEQEAREEIKECESLEELARVYGEYAGYFGLNHEYYVEEF